MTKIELEETLFKAVEYYFDGMNAKEAISKSLAERSNKEDKN